MSAVNPFTADGGRRLNSKREHGLLPRHAPVGNPLGELSADATSTTSAELRPCRNGIVVRGALIDPTNLKAT